jgi:hypothetical protein
MRAVVRYVAGHPGCSKSDAARCGDSGPLYQGSVERAIRRGYVRAEQDHPTARYRLFATDAGREFANAAAMRKLYREMDEQEMPGDPPFDVEAGIRDLKGRIRRERARMDNPRACGARENAPWGYLPCGCENDGFGNHAGYAR